MATTRQIPPLNLILAFDAVARIGSFSKAGDELNISTSSVSHRILELERSLGVTVHFLDSPALPHKRGTGTHHTRLITPFQPHRAKTRMR